VRALIVDEGRERCSVAVARALVARGWVVDAASPSPNIAARARTVSAWHPVAYTSDGDEAFVESVNTLVVRHGYDAVFASWETALAALSAHRDRLQCGIGYGPHEGLMASMDKEELMGRAARAGIATPRTVRATSETLAQMSGPIVVKPVSPVEAPLQTMVFDDAEAALHRALEIEACGGHAIAQEQLAGSLMAVSLVAGAGGIVSIAQQLAVHVWPTPVGVTARGITVAVDPELRARIERLLEDLAWQGLAQLQFLVSEEGEARLLDFNPRIYGSIALAIRAGANHPDAYARLAAGLDVAPESGRPGARFQWFTRDLRASLAAPRRTRELARCLSSAPVSAHSLWSPSEPWLAPRFLGEQALRSAARRLKQAPAPAEGEDSRSARLNGLPPTPGVLRALRTRRVPLRPERVAQRLLMKSGRMSYEQSWLAPLQSAREEALGARAEGQLRLLVRVDEFPYYSGLDTPKYGLEASRRFHAVMAEEKVPHLMAVLPQWTHDALNPSSSGGRPLDEHDVALLEQMRADGVTFAQHGHTHRTREANPRRHSEMCGLSAEGLEDMLEQGRLKLAAAGVTPRILVPPFNRFDAAQWPVLERRYDVITGGPESVMLMGFHGGPQWRGSAIYLPCYSPLYDSASTVLGAVEAVIDSGFTGWVPIVLHMGWEIDDDYAALRRLARRIAPYTASWDELLAAADGSRGASS
jgi:predicted ATP-grasp superfamily ATP-dependent carboligase